MYNGSTCVMNYNTHCASCHTKQVPYSTVLSTCCKTPQSYRQTMFNYNSSPQLNILTLYDWPQSLTYVQERLFAQSQVFNPVCRVERTHDNVVPPMRMT
jgi:hypothetical protein